MKNLKNVVLSMILLISVVFIVSCSSNPDPQIRIQNGQSAKVNMNILTSANNKISINGIEAGQVTEYRSVPEGNITATDLVRNESISFLGAKNTRYTIILSAGVPPTVQVNQ